MFCMVSFHSSWNLFTRSSAFSARACFSFSLYFASGSPLHALALCAKAYTKRYHGVRDAGACQLHSGTSCRMHCLKAVQHLLLQPI